MQNICNFIDYKVKHSSDILNYNSTNEEMFLSKTGKEHKHGRKYLTHFKPIFQFYTPKNARKPFLYPLKMSESQRFVEENIVNSLFY